MVLLDLGTSECNNYYYYRKYDVPLFRADRLDRVVFRMGIFAGLRSKFTGGMFLRHLVIEFDIPF